MEKKMEDIVGTIHQTMMGLSESDDLIESVCKQYGETAAADDKENEETAADGH